MAEPEVDVDDIIERLRAQTGTVKATEVELSEAEAIYLAEASLAIIKEQPCFLDLHGPVTLVGDVHGQYKDLLRAFEMAGWPPHTNYLFLGDYVDRGPHSFETLWLCLAYKIKYPQNVFLMRGNHECASINRIYGFYADCKRRYDVKMWKLYNRLFDWMPLAAVIERRIFVTHGGLSPDLASLDMIRNVQRPVDVEDFGLVCDLLWSDPEEEMTGWGPSDRGVSYTFGSDVVDKFLAENDFDLVVRAHQVVEHGYEFFGDQQKMVTIFTAPNYCGEFDNAGALMKVDADLTCSFYVLQPELEESQPSTAAEVDAPASATASSS